MSREDDIRATLDAANLKYEDGDGELADYCIAMAKHHLLGHGEPTPMAVEFVARAIIDAGRLLGASQIVRRNNRIEEKEAKRVEAFIRANKPLTSQKDLNN